MRKSFFDIVGKFAGKQVAATSWFDFIDSWLSDELASIIDSFESQELLKRFLLV